jgi:hypothetical protein
MPRITPQDLHKEMLLTNHDYPEDWDELNDEQRAVFIKMSRNLNRIADGESVWKPPTRRTLIAQHQRAIDELTDKPSRMGSWIDRFMEQSLDQNMMQYHKVALNYLESGGKIEDTIDALPAEELEEMMRAEGYFVCHSRYEEEE